MTDPRAAEEARLQQLAHEYASLGYEVALRPEPGPYGLPEDTEPDLVAIAPTDRVVVEVKSRGSIRASHDIETLAAFVEDRPEWRLELVAVNPLPAEPAGAPAAPTALIESRAREAIRLAEEGRLDAGLLLAWSALQGSLRELAARELGGARHEVRAKALYAMALLTDRQYELVELASRAYRAIARGYEAPELDVGLVSATARLALGLTDPGRPTATDLVEWFIGSAGPAPAAVVDDAAVRRALAERFPDADETDLADAVSQIRAELDAGRGAG